MPVRFTIQYMLDVKQLVSLSFGVHIHNTHREHCYSTDWAVCWLWCNTVCKWRHNQVKFGQTVAQFWLLDKRW